MIELKESDTKLIEEVRRTVTGAAWKLLHEWNKLYMEDGLLYRLAMLTWKGCTTLPGRDSTGPFMAK